MESWDQKAFPSQVFHLRAAMKTQRFANIWKTALAPFAPSNYAPGIKLLVWIISVDYRLTEATTTDAM